MKKITFREKILKHLIKWRKEEIKESGKGKWRGKYYKHILPKELAKLNILAEYREKFYNYNEENKDKIKFHECFAHLNSSQAMCINFFYPLYENKKLDLILEFIGFKEEKVDYNTVKFEKESDIEKNKGMRNPTSFDFYFETDSKKKFFFEIKYTEKEFGKANNKPDRQAENYNNIFRSILECKEKIIKIDAENEESKKEKFSDNYQILRNLICIDDNSYVVFLYPKDNEYILKAAAASKSFLQPDYNNHLINKTWEEVILFAVNKSKSENIKEYLDKFKKKYFE